jgi:hypothetical protein
MIDLKKIGMVLDTVDRKTGGALSMYALILFLLGVYIIGFIFDFVVIITPLQNPVGLTMFSYIGCHILGIVLNVFLLAVALIVMGVVWLGVLMVINTAKSFISFLSLFKETVDEVYENDKKENDKKENDKKENDNNGKVIFQ